MFMNFVPLKTERFALLALQPSDAPDLVRICSDESVYKFLFQIPVPYSLKDAEEFVLDAKEGWEKGDVLRWAVRTGEDTPVIACVELRQDQGYDSIGVWVDPAQRGKGVAFESISAVIEFARATNFTKNGLIGYSHHVDNADSMRLAKKLGFTLKHQANTKQYDVKDRSGRYFDFMAYYLPGTEKIL